MESSSSTDPGGGEKKHLTIYYPDLHAPKAVGWRTLSVSADPRISLKMHLKKAGLEILLLGSFKARKWVGNGYVPVRSSYVPVNGDIVTYVRGTER